MEEHPILFNSEMVRAVLDGRKTQTRRVLKPQPEMPFIKPKYDNTPKEWRKMTRQGPVHHGYDSCTWVLHETTDSARDMGYTSRKCPYGQVGDRLWVRETWCAGIEWDSEKPSDIDPLCGGNDLWYIAGQNEVENPDKAEKPEGYGKTRPNIFMPKWATRIRLEITNIRVERVQDISKEESVLEGIKPPPIGSYSDCYEIWAGKKCISNIDPRNVFLLLWDSINLKRGYGWDKNPWVWVVEFKKLTP